MDTNTLQILVTLLAQKTAAPVAGRSSIEITFLILTALSPLILAFAGWIKAQSIQADLKEVKEGVNGALDQMKALEHARGMDNGIASERSEQAKIKQTVDAVKEVIQVRQSPPAAVVTQEQIAEALKKMPPTL